VYDRFKENRINARCREPAGSNLLLARDLERDSGESDWDGS
jgi:hypothetical protein